MIATKQDSILELLFQDTRLDTKDMPIEIRTQTKAFRLRLRLRLRLRFRLS
jgi:hypothetical protein